MRHAIVLTSLCGVLLSGCNSSPEASSPESKSAGRFSGIGVFEVGRLWAEIAASTPKADPALARLADDEHIIVVLDSHTGEVRQCGDHSGYCVAMNPWKGAGAQATLPVRLTKHASDLVVEGQASNAVEN